MGNYENLDLGPAIRMGGRGHSNDSCEWNSGAAAANRCECDQCECNGRGSALALGNNTERIDGETHVYYETCDGAKEVTITSECHNDDSLGRVMDVNMKLCNVCPGRRCAVGIHLTEMDENGNEYQRGFRSLTVPAHNYSTNRDIDLPSLRFVMPEDVSLVKGGCRRHFVVRATNHYIEEPANCWNS